MPDQVLPHLYTLLTQLNGIVHRYRHMLDDDLLFAAAVQIPQVATILDRVAEQRLVFSGEEMQFTELLALIAYRYGLQDVRVIGHGGYAIVLGARDAAPLPPFQRVMRLVPEHHVRDVVARDPQTARPFDVLLDDELNPLRDPVHPLLLSDLFLLPRHTTTLVFCDEAGHVIEAGGYPARLHCQLLPEVRALNHRDLNPQEARTAGELLEAALATLGVSVADAHGGNGGVLLDKDGQPLLWNGSGYLPLVIDYGYYSRIAPRRLADILLHHGVTRAMVRACLDRHGVDLACDHWPDCLPELIAESGLPRRAFGRLLYELDPPLLDTAMWIGEAEQRWQTIEERIYPPLQKQSRLSRLYPDYDEVNFPQRIEEYTFTLR
ncbi:MAG: hypothetical protein GYB64_00515 [Chloroflexi bacterium]|nr:hypothetical protein [Chloroflexota bacterium]